MRILSHQPQLSSIDLWSSHEDTCLELLRQALLIVTNLSWTENEWDLNRHMYRAIIRASHQAARRGEDIPAVVPEGRNPPAASDDERREREYKIPDFYWAYIDPLAINPDDAAKQFVVECKRITKPRADYAREYVKSGIMRFISLGHGYGKGMKSGAMVGYLQDILLADANDRVNSVARANTIPHLKLRKSDGNNAAEFTHNVARSFRESPFRLTHIWSRIGPKPSR